MNRPPIIDAVAQVASAEQAVSVDAVRGLVPSVTRSAVERAVRQFVAESDLPWQRFTAAPPGQWGRAPNLWALSDEAALRWAAANEITTLKRGGTTLLSTRRACVQRFIDVTEVERAMCLFIADAVDLSFGGVLQLALHRAGFDVSVPPDGTRGPIHKISKRRPRFGLRLTDSVWADLRERSLPLPGRASRAQVIRQALEALYNLGCDETGSLIPNAADVWRQAHKDARK